MQINLKHKLSDLEFWHCKIAEATGRSLAEVMLIPVSHLEIWMSYFKLGIDTNEDVKTDSPPELDQAMQDVLKELE